jgi:hypothetical protein
MSSDTHRIALRDLFQPSGESHSVLRADSFTRDSRGIAGAGSLLLDRFSDGGGTSCGFLRLARCSTGFVRFVLEGTYGIETCPSGGWLLRPCGTNLPTYWIPREPILRAYDSRRRILSEETTALAGFVPTSTETAVDVATRSGVDLDCAIWHLPAEASGFVDELMRPVALERQPIFMLSSHTSFRGPADVYAVLVHGDAYENRFEWVRKRKTCSELEAYSAYVALSGLEAATQKGFYRLLKRQLVFSVIARQAQDGGWHHGEWTEFMESHYRFHSAAILLLEAALEEAPDDIVRNALRRATSALSRCTDRTDLGLWFLHDSLEKSYEQTEKWGIPWVPSRTLGKSLTTKMVLNSHLDAIVAMDRYREVTGDDQYAALVESALGTTRKLLALRPAEWLYRSVYWAIGLNLLPEARARQLPLALRAVKRVARERLIGRLPALKRRFPRMVMPGGLIERHLSSLHFGVNYHSVNLMDLARVWRRFPNEDFSPIVAGAIAAVTESSLPQYWAETRQYQALGYWVEALYQLCTLSAEPRYRRYLGEAMLGALDAGLGLPPSLLGANPEIVKPGERVPCPSPRDSRLRAANLSRPGHREILIVNPVDAPIELGWEIPPADGIVWAASDGSNAAGVNAPASVPPRGWLVGTHSQS